MNDRDYLYEEVDGLEHGLNRGLDDLHIIALSLVTLCKIMVISIFPDEPEEGE